ncbi:MAG: hypothetical protein QMB76_07260, partial [Alphaproteobacteria bacterium]
MYIRGLVIPFLPGCSVAVLLPDVSRDEVASWRTYVTNLGQRARFTLSRHDDGVDAVCRTARGFDPERPHIHAGVADFTFDQMTPDIQSALEG